MAKQVFAGLTIADFSWVGVGPLTTKYFADHGATVIRVESATHPDILRVAPPFAGNVQGIDRSGYYANFNSSKLCVSLNLNHPKSRSVVERLVRWADIMTESFSPRGMRKLGLSYEDVRKINPEIIMITMPLFGETGPHDEFYGFGHILQAAVGTNHLGGWPDREPVGATTAYTDFFAYHFSAVAVLAALDYKRRTGKGQHIDMSQFETSTSCLETAILDYTVNGRVQSRAGNALVVGDSPVTAPHGAYRCKGDDRWCVIAVFTDEEWRRMCEVMGAPALARDERFATVAARIANVDELEALISRWTEGQEAEEVMHRLQAAGVAAGVVQNTADLQGDPQLKHRNHYVRLDHPEMGNCSYDGWAFRLSKTPYEISKAAPLLGEDNDYVYRELLGLSDEEFVELLVDGVFE